MRAAFRYARLPSHNMKLYVAVTGTIFGLLTFAHLWRIIAENRHLGSEPIFLLLTVVAGALCVWAIVLLLRRSTS